MRGARLASFIFQIFYGRIEQGEDRNGGVVGTDFLDDAQALEAPGMKIDGQGVPASGGKETIELSRRMGTMHVQRSIGSFRKRMRNSQPGWILAQEQYLEDRVVHRTL